jgi:hypothetical protein
VPVGGLELVFFSDPVISDSDLRGIYGYFNTDTPTGLFYKVQMDIRLYFFRRGSENMHEMTVDTFCVETDSDTGIILPVSRAPIRNFFRHSIYSRTPL